MRKIAVRCGSGSCIIQLPLDGISQLRPVFPDWVGLAVDLAAMWDPASLRGEATTDNGVAFTVANPSEDGNGISSLVYYAARRGGPISRLTRWFNFDYLDVELVDVYGMDCTAGFLIPTQRGINACVPEEEPYRSWYLWVAESVPESPMIGALYDEGELIIWGIDFGNDLAGPVKVIAPHIFGAVPRSSFAGQFASFADRYQDWAYRRIELGSDAGTTWFVETAGILDPRAVIRLIRDSHYQQWVIITDEDLPVPPATISALWEGQ